MIFGETLVIHSRSGSTQDADGNDVPEFTDTSVSNVTIGPRSASELVQGQDTRITGIEAIVVGGVVLSGLDKVTISSGPYAGDYDVDGDPEQYKSSLTGTWVTKANLAKVTG